MMSVPRAVTISAAWKLLRPLRLTLKPDICRGVSATGYVDGAWWPYSRDLDAEVPALAKALQGLLDAIRQDHVTAAITTTNLVNGIAGAGGQHTAN